MMTLSEIARGVHGELCGGDARITGVSIDTRTLNRGELFVAIRGPNFDGHDFVAAAAEAGAAGAIVQSGVGADLPQIRVEDSVKALGDLAATWRERFSIPVIAVTGSNGKTTVKEMTGSIMSARAPALVSTGNLNNQIGVPLVLCGLRPEHQAAVVEMGMNRRGEIGRLSRIARPTVVVITNASAAHLQGVGTVEAVADEKGDILCGLGAGGVAVLNRDDAFYEYWRRMAGGNAVLSFGFDAAAEVRATDHAAGSGRFRLHLRDRACDVDLPLAGRHNVANALAAAAAAFAAGAELAQIRRGLEDTAPLQGRLCERPGPGGSVILDDTYNANPASVEAGIAVLAARPGRRILVLGDMGELGSDAARFHEQAGALARERGIDELHAVGEMGAAAAAAFGSAGRHHSDRGALVALLEGAAAEGTTILVKGSRFMRMDEIANALARGAAQRREAG